jgi:AAA+ ATPase superfamily predicted ATPase
MKQPSVRRPKFHVREIVPPELLVDRTEELQAIKDEMIRRKGNVLLVGKRGMGKTSLVHKAMHEMERERIMCVYIDLTIFFGREVDTFLEEVLLRICYEVGEKIFGKSTSALLLDLGQERSALKGKYAHFMSIFELARAKPLSQQFGRTANVGVTLPGIGAGITGTEERVVALTPLKSFEFINLVEELREICRGAKYERIIVFADEANRLAIQTSSDILQSYLDVFSSKQIQFLFVTNPEVLLHSPGVARAFARTIHLGPFRSIADVKTLLERYYSIESQQPEIFTPFSEEAIAKIWELSKGNPFLVQLLCDSALNVAGSRNIVTPDDVINAWLIELNHQPSLAEYLE